MMILIMIRMMVMIGEDTLEKRFKSSDQITVTGKDLILYVRERMTDDESTQ